MQRIVPNIPDYRKNRSMLMMIPNLSNDRENTSIPITIPNLSSEKKALLLMISNPMSTVLCCTCFDIYVRSASLKDFTRYWEDMARQYWDLKAFLNHILIV